MAKNEFNRNKSSAKYSKLIGIVLMAFGAIVLFINAMNLASGNMSAIIELGGENPGDNLGSLSMYAVLTLYFIYGIIAFFVGKYVFSKRSYSKVNLISILVILIGILILILSFANVIPNILSIYWIR
ncbi:hypothetical protein [Asaccharospora irregularis]|uniref:Uncharacterized protein n=1 Tax=Asaccharospora irregularis DSM 2635 TaxID=1121321 RepID=A0A1M5M9G9_9FIRM|nr:hypothetical protein [Asaccharospora irregularis]SHG73881.1 hypothetical protein SAMN04488530_10682 [Asaccharospora irregularis DSM 2635]